MKNKIINEIIKITIITIIISNIFLEILSVYCVDVFVTIIVKYKELVHSPVKKNRKRNVSHYNIMSTEL